ncbi:O-methylsterigmatocystin oxidoreductase [Cubamyces lactineus]|nr:O-methylsterigmatocystin oxidoreductase [Cubamyces lactineus]
MWPFHESVLFVALLASVVIYSMWRQRKCPSSSLPLPPGPKPLPIIGNLLDMPTKRLGPALRELGAKYGDVTYLDMFGQPMLIINTYEAAVGLLESRSSNTSDRPSFVMAELTDYGWITGLIGYTQRWRRRRRAFHRTFQLSAMPKHRPVLLRECHRMLQKLLDSPEKFLVLGRHMFGATSMEVVYGIAVTVEDDPYISLAENATKVFTEITVPGRFIVELLPFIRHLPSWLPGMGFKRVAANWCEDVRALRNVPFEAAVKEMAKGDHQPSMVSSLLDEALSHCDSGIEEDPTLSRDAAGVAYVAGADTTAYSLQAFFLAMVQNPDVLRKAQSELDAVVGSDRLPDFSDRASLPYVNAVIQEVKRWHSVAPVGISHRSTAEDEWNGYRIPAGTIIVPNQWAMWGDPTVYPEPEKFIPERFLAIDAKVRSPDSYQFGFGRRICPGRHFANEALYITVASVLHVFNIDPPLDDKGQPMRVEPEIVLDYFLAYPEPFECRISPRSTSAEALIRSSVQIETK